MTDPVPDTGTQYAGLSDVERAAAMADPHMQACDAPTIDECRYCRSRLVTIRELVAAVSPVIRRQVAEELRAVASGRSEYLDGDVSFADADPRVLMGAEVITLQTAAEIVEGDITPLFSLLPAWRWTDEMNAQVDAEIAAAAIARSHSTQPTGDDHG